MDIVDLLKNDHRRIARLFDVIKEETDREACFLLFESIKRQLELHFQAEEECCYPIFLKRSAFRMVVCKSSDDHLDIRKLLEELSNTPETRDGIAFQNRLLELKNHVESHIVEEERDLFELVSQELDASERENLGNLFTLAKSKFERLVA
jgi:hemerythrin superfamily protein